MNMHDLFDIRILSFVSSIISLVLCICMIYVARTRKTYNGFTQWTIASVLYIFALALLSMRSVLPDFFSVIVGNLLIVAGNGLIAYGLERFTKVAKRAKLFIGLTGIMFVAFVFFTYFQPNVNARIIVISTIIILYYLYCSFLVHRHVPRLINSHNKLLVVAFSVQAFWLALRIMQTIFIESPLVDFMRASAFHGITVIVFFCGNILIVIGLIALNFQRVEYDLSVAMSEVKTLQGLIPICASCKKIRDDQGIWNQIETYIRDHSDVKFSHSICPECMQKLYPDLMKKDET